MTYYFPKLFSFPFSITNPLRICYSLCHGVWAAMDTLESLEENDAENCGLDSITEYLPIPWGHSHEKLTSDWLFSTWFTPLPRHLLCVALAILNSPCWPGWLQSHKDRPISASLLDLKECMTTVWLKIWFSKLELFDSLWCNLGKFCFKCLLWRCNKHVPESPSARHRP